MKRLLSISFLLVGLVGSLIAQPVARVKVVGVPDLYKARNANQATTGLRNVGVGERIVLQPVADMGTRYSSVSTAVQSAVWTVTARPGGSTAPDPADTTAGLNGLYVYFVPDVAGVYTIQMTATTDSGVAAPVTVTVTAGTYKGVGVYNTATTQLDNFACAPCHSQAAGVFKEWLGTKHATVMPRRLDEVGGHFADYCLRCHTVGYTAGTNGGFDDLKTSTGWTVPPNGLGVYDSTKTFFPGLMQLAGIQCENCHGPAAQHALTGDRTKVDKSFSSEVCGPCHFSSDRHPKGYSWDASGHAIAMVNGSSPQYMNRAGCTQCHTAQGFVNQIIKGNPEPVVPSGQRVFADAQPITCQACHDPHSEHNQWQLRRASVADACTGCHTTRLSSHSGLHHSHQGQMLLGVLSEAYNGQPGSVGDWSGWELPGYNYENGGHSDIADRCVECHMAKTPTHDPTFATPDTLLNRVGGHSFAIVWDRDTPLDEADDLLNPVGCRDCHGEVSLEFVRLSQEKIKKLLDTLDAYLPQRTDGTPLFPQAIATQPLKAASYNYYFVQNDGSYGVHNPMYAKQLLESSIEQVKLGAGAAAIAGVGDVPNDNGRRVHVIWNRFPAEGFSFDKLTSYGIWRRDASPIAGKFLNVKNFREMMIAGPVGTQVSLAGNVWTYVAQVPATNLAQYSYIAPTLADSTVTGGMKWTTFYVAGYTGTGAALYASAPDSGYSVDNLRPVPPSGLVVSLDQAGVKLVWNAPTDTDVDFFNVYKSTTQGFDPTGMTPVAQVKGIEYVDGAVTTGMRYYYRLEAVDLAGNRSGYSPEGSIVFTSVKEVGGVPTVFALEQNYPNPFNPSTDIRFALPKATHVTLSVYTVSGELVATLLDDVMSAGTFSVTWNGQSSGGRSVSSGLYLYRIQASDFTAVRKMVLVK